MEERMSNTTTLPRYLRPAEVCERLGLSRSTLWRMTRDGRLPRPIKLGPGIAAFEEAALIAAVGRMRGEAEEDGDDPD
jgi:predicted DNA-binding transcriptional regulator AlpA